MRSLLAEDIAPLVGSLGLHALFVLAFVFATHHPPRRAAPIPERPDAWLGNAVEVDAVTAPEATPSTPSAASEAANVAPTANDSALTKPYAQPPAISDTGTPSPPKAAQPTGAQPPLKARPARATKPRLESARGDQKSDAHAASENPSSASSAAPAVGTFGGEGLPPGVRSLPSAFTRAIPPATGADPVWQTLPIGSEHPFTIAIEVDAEGHIASAEIVKEKDGSEPPIQAVHLKQRVVALLGGGLFALQNNIGEGHVLFRITITLSDRAVHEEDDPAMLVERGFDPPHDGSAGRAYFTLASGRHFEARVQVLSQK